MKEQTISYNTAVLAKEKGFDILDKLIGSHHTFFKHDETIIVGDSFAKQLLFYAPPQSVLQRWLREVHKILLTVEFTYGDGEATPKIYTIGANKNKPDEYAYLWQGEFHDSYEVALEKGLRKALELIEDVRG